MMMRKQITAKTTPTIIGVLGGVLGSVSGEFTWVYDNKCYYIIKHVPQWRNSSNVFNVFIRIALVYYINQIN